MRWLRSCDIINVMSGLVMLLGIIVLMSGNAEFFWTIFLCVACLRIIIHGPAVMLIYQRGQMSDAVLGYLDHLLTSRAAEIRHPMSWASDYAQRGDAMRSEVLAKLKSDQRTAQRDDVTEPMLRRMRKTDFVAEEPRGNMVMKKAAARLERGDVEGAVRLLRVIVENSRDEPKHAVAARDVLLLMRRTRR